MSEQNLRDPRNVLVREKYFNLRPQPLEQWLWKHRVPPAAERVFWLHWQEGMRNADWSSSIPLKRVASLCCLDVSSVSRSYQVLIQLGLICREDPGRDPQRPHQQAVLITEVRLPRELIQELNRFPNRTHRPEIPTPMPTPDSLQTHTADHEPTPPTVPDPFPGMTGRDRVRAISTLLDLMTPQERFHYNDALRTHKSQISFNDDSALSPEQRATILQLLEIAARAPIKALPNKITSSRPSRTSLPTERRLSALELARLRRELNNLRPPTDADELFKQITWSVEEGALRRFTSLHAIRIALKKVREGFWTPPRRMPPHWVRALSRPLRAAVPETCNLHN